MLKVAVLVSGGGSNLQSILDYGQETFKVEMVIGSKEGIYGLERAKNAGVPTYVVSRKEYGNETSNKILELTRGKVDLIVLAGYLSRASGVRFTGCTVHFVNEEVDGGAIILQEVVPVHFDDTAEDIQKRVLVEEHKLLPKAIDLISMGKIDIIDGRVNILK